MVSGALMYSFLALGFSSDVLAMAENMSMLTTGILLMSALVAFMSSFVIGYAIRFMLEGVCNLRTDWHGSKDSTEYVDIDWTQRARQLEKGFTYENRLSELTYKVKGDNVDNLSAAKDDSKTLESRIDWVAFKNQFFSSVFIAEQDFDKVSVKSRMEQQGSGYIKDYSAEMNTFFDPSKYNHTAAARCFDHLQSLLSWCVHGS